jgi:phosphopantetheinyl transferase
MHAVGPPCDYRYAPLDELHLPSTTAWLCAEEQAACARFRDAHRRRAWLSGRLLAKRLVCSRLAALGLDCPRSAAQIAIRSSAHRPVVLLDGRCLPWSLSISHTQRAVLAALSSTPRTRIGVDLVAPQLPGRGFAEAWFSPRERRAITVGDLCALARLWAIKEAAYKAAGHPRPFDPRTIEVDLHAGCAVCFATPATRVCRVLVWRTTCDEIAVFASYIRPSAAMVRGASAAAQRILAPPPLTSGRSHD